MTQLIDREIRDLCIGKDVTKPMLKPFLNGLCSEKSVVEGSRIKNAERVMSFGLSSMGYDCRLAEELRTPNTPLLDPKAIKDTDFTKFRVVNGFYDIPPHGFVLGSTIEYFQMPSDTVALCVGKSSYARLGLVVNVTPIEPGWHGNVTLELSNTTDSTIRIYVNEGIAQFIFYRSPLFPETCYATRNGKYQGQTGVTLSRI